MSVRNLLRSLRRMRVVNYPIRNMLRSTSKLLRRMSAHWPVAGIIRCQYNGLNFKLYNECDDHQVDFYYYDWPFHEAKIINLMNSFARRSKVILDIGANTGIHSVIVSRMNPGTKIYAIEPYQSNYTRLERNLQLNDCRNVEIKKIALGEKAGELTFFIPSDNSITDVSSAVENHGTRIYESQITWKKSVVQQLTLDELAGETGRIDFFKCDVESFEMNVFKGASVFFDNNRPSFILEITLNEEKVDYFNAFADKYGYTIYYINDDGIMKIDKLYVFDRWPNFLFTQFNSKYNFIPFRDMEKFVEMTFSGNTVQQVR